MADNAIRAPERVLELSRYVPEFLRDYTELRALYRGEEEEFRELYGHFDSVWTASLIKEADLQGVIRYEKLLGLASDRRLTLEERRAIVLMKWDRQLPYTLRRLVEQLKLWSGDEPFVVDTSRFKEYKLRIEVFNQTLAALRGIKEITEEIIPANLIMSLYGRYPSEYEVPIHYDNAIHFQTSFYPQHNLPPHLLEGAHFLDGGKVLNGYAIDQTIDLYPVNLNILSEINQPIIVATTLGVQTDTVVGGKLDASLNLEAEANEGIVEEVSLNLQCSGEVVGSGAAELTVEDHLRYLDGNGTLNGEGYLNADIYHYVL